MTPFAIRRSRRSALSMTTALIATLALVSAATAKDYFLTIGGGYNPTGNQISLEKNVLYFQRILKDFNLADAPHSIFFADGTADGRDLQYADEAFAGPKVLELLARITNQTHGLYNEYRSNEIPNVTGPSSVAELDKWFSTVGASLGPDDRVLIYATAHGGKASGKEAENTRLFLWNDQAIQMRDFVARLDKIPAQTPVVLVMVQCFSGGFANVIFNEGDDKKGLSASRRCGFFATVQTRPAAGCTPDINEANYHEYSTFFWEAIFGKTRLDQPVTQPDFDGDGQISFAEAHAYTIIHSSTIDIPVKTSDAFLRTFSKTKDKDKPDLMTGSSKYDDLLAMASPVDKVVLDSLCTELKLTGDDRNKAAEDLAKSTEEERKKLAGESSNLQRQYNDIRQRIFLELRNRWPEIGNPWHPGVQKMIHNDADAIVKVIEGHKDFAQLLEIDGKRDAVELTRLDLERRWVKCQRVQRVLENVALAANLAKIAPDRQADYAALLERESGVLARRAPGGGAQPVAATQ